MIALYPAYGRRYPDPADMLKDWEAGKDFSVYPDMGPYTSIRDIDSLRDRFTTVYLVEPIATGSYIVHHKV